MSWKERDSGGHQGQRKGRRTMCSRPAIKRLLITWKEGGKGSASYYPKSFNCLPRIG